MSAEETPMMVEYRECPNCGSTALQTRVLPDRFTYGSGTAAVELCADVPFHRCADCQFEFTGAEAEDARHEAVCRYLRVMSPGEVRAVRGKYEMTRLHFAEITRIGSASLSRWENGELIQNPANDQLLYLLTFEDNLQRLHERWAPVIESVSNPSAAPAAPIIAAELREGSYPQHRLRLRAVDVNAESVRREASAFDLRRPRLQRVG